MRYSYEFKVKCVEMYERGEYPDTPSGITTKKFRDTIRKWKRMIDQYFDYKHGELEYRSLRFEHEVLDEENYQGNAVVNYTEREVPYTRIIEHKHFEKGTQEKTVITREYSVDWKRGDEPYYPINDAKNNEMYQKYLEEAKGKDVIFCGRLADYKYYDMHVVIERALNVVREELNR